jgi:iron complex outermembrane recepter protein
MTHSFRRRRSRTLATAALACTVTSAVAAHANDSTLSRLSLEELSSLEITSVSKRAEPLSDAPTSVFVITADDIRRSGAASLPEVLRLAPNLHVARASASGHSISARGSNGTAANKLLVLIDGRSVYTPLFSGVFWDVQDLMLQDIERIEVISGPGGTLWGTNAVNGIINVISRSARDTQGSLVSAAAGNRDAVLAARHGTALGDDASLRLYAKHTRRRHTETAAGTAVDDAVRHTQAGLRADWSGGRDAVSVTGNAYEGRFGQPLPGTINVTGFTLALGDIPVSGANLLARWTRELDDDGSLSVQAYYDRTSRTVPPTFAEALQIMDLQAQHSFRPAAAHQVVWGAQVRRSHDHVRNSEIVAFLPAVVDQSWTSLFAQDEIALRDDLRLTLGARLEHNDYTGNEFLPNARLAWKAAPEQLLWAAASRTVRAPSRLDRDTFVPGRPPFILAGGSRVRSELANVLEAGWRGRPAQDASMSVTAFHAEYDHLRTQQIDSSRTFIEFENGMEGRVRGIEAWGTWEPRPHWRLSAGFTRLWQSLKLKPGSNDALAVAIAEGANPARQALLRSSLDIGPRTELDITARHVSALSAPAVPAYTALDVRWGWQVSDRVELALTGQNLLDPGHGEFTDLATRTEIGRALFVELTARF